MKWIILVSLLFLGCSLEIKDHDGTQLPTVNITLTNTTPFNDIGLLNHFGVLVSKGHQESNSPLWKEDINLWGEMESTPFIFHSNYFLMLSCRGLLGGDPSNFFMAIIRVDGTNQCVAKIGFGTGLASAVVVNDTLFLYSTRWSGWNWNEVWVFTTKDMTNWTSNICLSVNAFNTSVCWDGTNFIMAWEHGYFYPEFASSKDGTNFTSMDRRYRPANYTACPTIRYLNGWYYLFYLDKPGDTFVTCLTRTRDFVNYQESPKNPIISPESGENINTSDVDLVEWNGEVHFYYAISDQNSFAIVRRAKYEGTLSQFFEWAFN